MLDEHHVYVSDRVRLERFAAAVQSVLSPGQTVVDLGCGTGILGLLCLKAGAGHVYAIERGDMAQVATRAYAEAGFTDRVTVIQEENRFAELPQRVDLVICDHVGYFGIDYGIVDLLRDARERFLKPGGQLIPRRLRIMVAAVESAEARKKRDGWEAIGIAPELHWLRTHEANSKHEIELTKDEILNAPAYLGDVDLLHETRDYFTWTTDLKINRDGQLDGVAGWFECELADRVWMTNAPLADSRINREQTYLPIQKSISVSVGDVLKVSIMMRPADNLIAWTLACPEKGFSFSQSTWHGLVLDPAAIVRAKPDRIPQLSKQGLARLAVLASCDGGRTVADIQKNVLTKHPELFRDPDDCARIVAEVLSRNTELS